MHSVIRKRQGLPYTPEQPKGLIANSQHLIGVQVRAGPFPTDELATAYSARSYPKLVGQATSEDDALRRKALSYLNEMLRSTRELSSLVPAGIVPALTQTAEVGHCVESRTLATAGLLPLARDLNGRAAILAEGSTTVPTLLRLVCDKDPQVRCNALAVCLQLARFGEGSRALIAGGCVALLVKRCTEEALGEQLAAVLAALNMVCDTNQEGLDQAIAGSAIETACGLVDGKYLLEQPSPAVCADGFALLRTLTIGAAEKQLAVKQGVLRVLVVMLTPTQTYPGEEEDPELLHRVATEAAGALMSLTVDTECKSEAVRLGAIRPLSQIMRASLQAEQSKELSYDNSTLTNNASKCIANLAECPAGRKQLRSSTLPDLEQLELSAEPLVAKHAALAVYKTEWQP